MTDRAPLTLKYRPRTFDELLIQDHVRTTLKRALERGRFANAYLFAGPRGVGKTTAARILAKSLNCLSHDKPTTEPCGTCSACVEIAQSRSMDVLEIDGASNRGIDQIRELRENIKYSPASLRYKVYIIDEVHMLTPEAFNALLKTLEEPPPHARFIFATTAAHKMPTTIISRCQRFDFRRATPEEIASRLRWIAEREDIKATDEALAGIARRADGALRDGESILDQLATYRPDGIELADVEELLGLVPSGLVFDYVDLLLAGDARGLLQSVDRLFERGYDLVEFFAAFVGHLRNLMLVIAGGPVDTLGLLPAERERLGRQAEQLTRPQLLAMLESAIQAEETVKSAHDPRTVLEYLSLELAGPRSETAPAAPVPPAPRKTSPAPKKKTKPAAPADRVADARPAAADPVEERLRKTFGDVEEESSR